jgi:hypothetical protein
MRAEATSFASIVLSSPLYVSVVVDCAADGLWATAAVPPNAPCVLNPRTTMRTRTSAREDYTDAGAIAGA